MLQITKNQHFTANKGASYFLTHLRHIWIALFLISTSNVCYANPQHSVKEKGKDDGISDYPEMVYVKGGSFTMGCTNPQTVECSNAELPAHKVMVSDFFISKYLITVKEFRKFINGSRYKTTAETRGNSVTVEYGNKMNVNNGVTWEYDAAGNKRDKSQDDQPVVHISWDDAKAYCDWLSKETGKTYRLPTEAEWEFAARGGTKSKEYRFSGGNNFLDIGWFSDNSGNQTHKVGQKNPNELGLYDMNGNVWEWVNDWYDEAYYAISSADNPKGAKRGKFKLMRGGSWNNDPEACTVYFRNYHEPEARKGTYGFRIAGDSIKTMEEIENETVAPSTKKQPDTTAIGKYSEENYDFSKVDRIALGIPDASLTSTQAMADYFVSKFPNQRDRVRAIYIWITENIDYDPQKMYEVKNGTSSYFQNEKNEIANLVLKSGKGVCGDYSCLFTSIANKAGLNSFVVLGYTNRHDFDETKESHAWCAAEINSKWYLFDPTWGAGHLMRHQLSGRMEFRRKIDNYYFMTTPEDFIKTHMPFDPLWQFLHYPISRDEFYSGIYEPDKNKPYYNYTDTLNDYVGKSDFDRFVSSYERIKRNGMKDSMIARILRSYNSQIVYYRFYVARNSYQVALGLMNKFLEYKEKKFIPQKTNPEIQKMLDDAENTLSQSETQIKRLEDADSKTQDTMNDLQENIDDLKIKIGQQRKFLEEYFKTGKFN